MPSKTIAAQMYTIREFCRTPADIAASLKKLADIGYGAVQASGLGPLSAAELKKMLDDNGIVCAATHVGWDQLANNIGAVIADLKTLGCQYTAIGGMPGEFRNPDAIGRFGEQFDKAGAALRAEGLSLGYHNHSFEFEKFGGKLLLDMVYESTSRENVWAEIDTYWVQHGGGDPAAWIRRFRGHIPVVHFKDFGFRQGKQIMLEIGEGNLNWPEIIKACRGAKVKWFAVEQDDCNGRDPFESLAISLRNMLAMGLK